MSVSPPAFDGLTLLLLGTSELIPGGHRPFLAHLASLGCRSVVCAGAVDPRVAAQAWKVCEVDPASAAAVRAAVEGVRFDAVLPLCDDALETASELAAERGLPHYSGSTCDRLRSKAELKRALRRHGVPTADFETAPARAAREGAFVPALAPPWVVKPSRSTGGSVGVFRAQTPGELAVGLRARECFYGDGEVLVEPLLAGTEHSLEVIVLDGAAHVLSISDKRNYPGNAAVVQELLFPGPVGRSNAAALGRAVARLPAALGLSRGVMHIEFIVTPGGPVLIDLSLRPGGSYNLHPICRVTTGHDYPAALVSAFAGLPRMPTRGGAAGAIAWLFFDPARLSEASARNTEAVAREPDVIAAELLFEPRRLPCALDKDADRPGYVMVQAGDPSAARRRAHALAERLYA